MYSFIESMVHAWPREELKAFYMYMYLFKVKAKTRDSTLLGPSYSWSEVMHEYPFPLHKLND